MLTIIIKGEREEGNNRATVDMIAKVLADLLHMRVKTDDGRLIGRGPEGVRIKVEGRKLTMPPSGR